MDHEKEYQNLVDKETEIKLLIGTVMQDYAEKNCPYKIGEKIPIKGYSYTGRMGVVKYIRGSKRFYERGNEKLGWTVGGIVCKKDGTEGSLHWDFREWQDKKE